MEMMAVNIVKGLMFDFLAEFKILQVIQNIRVKRRKAKTNKVCLSIQIGPPYSGEFLQKNKKKNASPPPPCPTAPTGGELATPQCQWKTYFLSKIQIQSGIFKFVLNRENIK